jgi:hypothetical protein
MDLSHLTYCRRRNFNNQRDRSDSSSLFPLEPDRVNHSYADKGATDAALCQDIFRVSIVEDIAQIHLERGGYQHYDQVELESFLQWLYA